MSVELANYLDPHNLYTEGNLVLLDLNAPQSSTSGLDFTTGGEKAWGDKSDKLREEKPVLAP